MKTRMFIAATLSLLFVSAAVAQQTTTVMPFGNGYIATTPGAPPVTAMPFGNGAIINTPGQAPTTVTPFGNGYIVNQPAPPPAVGE